MGWASKPTEGRWHLYRRYPQRRIPGSGDPETRILLILLILYHLTLSLFFLYKKGADLVASTGCVWLGYGVRVSQGFIC
jgi:hypothetical protein